jgi:hypothetical protein
VPTTGISLVREHTEKIEPPRALWVPFEFGRPLGPPDEPEFQLDVLRSALRLLERDAGPVLEDYPYDAPAAEGGEPWACPIELPAPEPAETEAEALRQRLLGEVALLRPWYDEAVRSLCRSAVGLSGLGADSMEEIAAFLAAFAADDSPSPPDGATESMPALLRFVTDDLRAYYFEAAAAQPGRSSPTSTELNDWLYGETAFGDTLYRLRDRLTGSDNPMEKGMVAFIIPTAYYKRPG